jgi:hypothetical protein
MTLQNQNWQTIHPSVYRDAAGPAPQVAVTRRAQGALRYQCPVTLSLILVTDETALASLDRPQVRLRCPDCGEMHLLVQAAG